MVDLYIRTAIDVTTRREMRVRRESTAVLRRRLDLAGSLEC